MDGSSLGGAIHVSTGPLPRFFCWRKVPHEIADLAYGLAPIGAKILRSHQGLHNKVLLHPTVPGVDEKTGEMGVPNSCDNIPGHAD